MTELDLNTRLAAEQGIARRVADIVECSIEALGFRLVRVRLTGDGGQTLQVMAERPETGQLPPRLRGMAFFIAS